MIRSFLAPRAALAAAAVLALTACPHHDGLQGAGGRCSTRASCRPDLVCLSGTCAAEAPASPTCNPATSAPTVTYAGVAGPATDPGCVTTVQAAIPAAAEHVGTFTVGTTTPAFTVPDGTVSFSIVSQAVSAPETVNFTYQGTAMTWANWPVPRFVTAPGGRSFYDDVRDFWSSDPKTVPGLEAYYGGIVPGVGAFTTPNTSHGLDLLYSSGKLQSGGWSLVVGDLAYDCATALGFCAAGGSTSSSYDVSVIPKAGPIRSTGTLDVSVYFVSARGVPNEITGAQAALVDAPNPPPVAVAFRQLVASLSTVFRRLGICLGQVKVYDLQNWARDKYSTLSIVNGGRCGDLAQLSTLSQADEAVHLFLVDGFNTGTTGGPQLAGIDGSIAGPSGVPGTTTSGAAVGLGADLTFSGQCLAGSFDPAHCGPDSLAYVAAHEAGHWLGLFHTTESTGGSNSDPLWDPLDDTGTCSCACLSTAADRTQCLTGDKDLGTSSCVSSTNDACKGGENLMFWLFSPGNSQGAVSPQQGRVARLNPAVH